MDRLMDIRRQLIGRGYREENGFFIESGGGEVVSEADAVWSKLSAENPLHAAAAATGDDPFGKYPLWIEAAVVDSERLVLDAGCGYGRIAIPLLHRCPRLQLVGVDASSVMLKTFRRLLQSEAYLPLAPRVLLLQSGIERIPLSDGSFDVILSCAVLLHNPYRTVEEILREFHRLLKPSGRLVLSGSFPNLWNPEGLQNYVYANWMASPQANGPVRAYTRRRVENLFSEWRGADLIPRGRIILPREIAGIRTPFGGWIRRLNAWVDGKASGIPRPFSPFAQYFDVIAEK